MATRLLGTARQPFNKLRRPSRIRSRFCNLWRTNWRTWGQGARPARLMATISLISPRVKPSPRGATDEAQDLQRFAVIDAIARGRATRCWQDAGALVDTQRLSRVVAPRLANSLM